MQPTWLEVIHLLRCCGAGTLAAPTCSLQLAAWMSYKCGAGVYAYLILSSKLPMQTAMRPHKPSASPIYLCLGNVFCLFVLHSCNNYCQIPSSNILVLTGMTRCFATFPVSSQASLENKHLSSGFASVVHLESNVTNFPLQGHKDP